MNDQERQDAYDALISFLESNNGEYMELTPKKIRERSQRVSDPNYPDLLVLDVERHRAIAGSRYVKGLPMSGFETYLQRITFDPQTRELSEVGRRTVGSKIDISAIASECVDDFWPMVRMKKGCKNKRVVTISTNSSFRVETSSLAKAIEAVRRYFEEMDHSVGLTGFETEEETSDYAMKLAERAGEEAARRIEEGWENAPAED